MDDDDAPRISSRKVQLMQVRMSEQLIATATDTCDIAMDTMTVEKDIAAAIKQKFDSTCGGTWHCVVGRNFGCSVTHETKYLCFFKVDSLHCLLFCSDEPVPPVKAEKGK
mmetsp:Transcript_74981/g.150754  ORF Transcript_74981/g.150754 Transcript_74981/m.150754 type:complete len:110 (+) Transcript_74981:49-378(+)